MNPQTPEQERVVASLNMAMNHFREGRLDEAEAICKEILQRHPGQSDTCHVLGLISLQKNDYATGMELVTEAIQNDPTIADYYNTLGMAHRQQGRLANALELFQVALQLRSEFPEAALNLAGIYLEQGKAAGAEEVLKRLLEKQPRHVGALLRLAQLYLGQNRPDEAEPLLQTAIEEAENNPEAHFILGNLRRLQGKEQQAIDEYQRAIKSNPGYADAYLNLGLLAAGHGQYEQAEKFLRKAKDLAVAPSHLLLVSLGMVLYELEQFQPALDCLREALKMKPHLAITYNQAGLIFERTGGFARAIDFFNKAIALNPNLADAYYNRGIALAKAMRHDESIASYRKAIEINPKFDKAHNNLGYMLIETGDMDGAEAAIKQALELRPDYEAAHNNLGIVLRQKGDLAGGNTCFQRALELNPEYAEAHRHLAVSTKYSKKDMSHAKQLEELVAGGKLSTERRMHAKYALGKIYDDCGMYEKAFEAFHEANEIRKTMFPFDVERHHEIVSQIISTFSADFFDKRQGFGFDDETPVFIVGMPRSGTTLVEQIISSHPKAFGAGELGAIRGLEGAVARELRSETPFPMVSRLIDRKTAGDIGQGYVKHLRTHSTDASRITDKMPDNFLSVGFIKLILPKAKIIHCRRDPRDSGLSIYFQCFTFGNGYAYDLQTIGQYYNEYDRIMQHWKSLKNIEILDVQYEEMIENQEAMSRRLIDFVGLEWDKKCLSFHKTSRVVKTASVDQVRRPLYKSSVARWRPYEQWLGPLLETVGNEGLPEAAEAQSG